jgi:hypothetical protein
MLEVGSTLSQNMLEIQKSVYSLSVSYIVFSEMEQINVLMLQEICVQLLLKYFVASA